eukprot:GHRQ01036481.1.p1 GENE.GHRQ01036481.1~~GHRQ01036481.1.p1  ORF type:complete len:155 (+),score=48.63 GHRQ01036481.1:2-466(+)
MSLPHRQQMQHHGHALDVAAGGTTAPQLTCCSVSSDFRCQVGQGMGVLVERCRYLEQAGCASICINSCKVPTQEFFEKDMGLPLTMTPNYEDFSCQFSFGKTPLPQQLDEAFSTLCFQQCPSRAARYADCSKQADGADCPNVLKQDSRRLVPRD